MVREAMRYRTYHSLRIFRATRAEAEFTQLRLRFVAEGVETGFGGLVVRLAIIGKYGRAIEGGGASVCDAKEGRAYGG